MYKNLNLEHDKIEETLASFLNKNYQGAEYDKDPQKTKEVYTINADGKVIKFEVYLNKAKGGTITLNYKIGKHHDIGERIAEYIKSTLINDERKNVTISLKNINKGQLDELFEYITECEFSEEKIEIARKDINYGEQYIITREKTGEKVVFSLYNTGSLTINSRPIFLFTVTQAYCIESGWLKAEEIIQNYSKIEIDSSNIFYDLEKSIPSAFPIIKDNIKELMSTSLILEKINVDLFDYTAYVFPVLKGLEACMKSILATKEIMIDKNFTCFCKGCLNSETRSKINNEIISKELEVMYKHLDAHRHTLFHVDASVEAMRMIEKKESAVDLIHETLSLIDESYRKMNLN